ncbi:uncharacterized protein LOC123552740, partial [Mercenaria mercenaria]|uniref:uncharacterized protein LOC123552740 n=1 Tax=Mercenaria mercenaria TaxID=6596 RepID=UPI00234E3AE7
DAGYSAYYSSTERETGSSGTSFTTEPAIFLVKIKFTSLQFTEEIRDAGKDVGRLAITKELESALEKLFSSLRGCIQVRIVGFQSGSLMVNFYIYTDGKSTEREIVQLLNKTLSNGNFSGHIVSTEGFEFRGIREPIEIIVPPPTPPLVNVNFPLPRQPHESTVNTGVDGHTNKQLSTLSAPLSKPEAVSTPNLSSGAIKSSQPIIVNKTTNIHQGRAIKRKCGYSLKSKNKNVTLRYSRKDVKDGEDKHLLENEVTESEYREDSKSTTRFEDQQTVDLPKAAELFCTDDTTCTQPIKINTAEDLKDCSGVSAGTSDDGAEKANTTSELTNVEADSGGKLRTKSLSEKQISGQSNSPNLCRRTSVSLESVFSPQYNKPIEIIVPQPTPPLVNVIVPSPRHLHGSTVNTGIDGHTNKQLSAPLSEPEDVSTPNLSSGAVKSSQPIIVNKTTNIHQGRAIKRKCGNSQVALGEDSPKSKNKNVKMTYNRKDVKDGEDKHLLENEVTESEYREDSKSTTRFEDQQTVDVPKAAELFYTDDTTCTQPIKINTAEDLKDCSGVSAGTSDDGAEKANTTSELTNVEADSEGKLRTKSLSEKQISGKSNSPNLCRRTSVSLESVFSPPFIQNVESLFKDSDEYNDSVSSSIDTKMEGQEQLGNIQGKWIFFDNFVGCMSVVYIMALLTDRQMFN